MFDYNSCSGGCRFCGSLSLFSFGGLFEEKEYKISYKSECLFRTQTRALEGSCAIEGLWSLSFISIMVYPPLSSCNLCTYCSQLLPSWTYMFSKWSSSFGMIPYPFTLETAQWTRRTSGTVCGFSMEQLGVPEARIYGRVKGSCTRAEEAVSSTFNNQRSNRFSVPCCQGNKFWLA